MLYGLPYNNGVRTNAKQALLCSSLIVIIKGIIKESLLKHKRILLIVFAIVFIALLFFSKTKSQFKNQSSQDAGLAYGDIMVKDLLNKDNDLDGVLDWEESLYGTDPTSKDTDGDGEEDKAEIAKMKPPVDENGEILSLDEENLTQTDKFSRELFATVATLNQTGQMDEATVEKLSTSLAEQIKNSTTKKVFLISETNVESDNSSVAYQNYSNALDSIYQQYPPKGNVLEILQEFIGDGEDVNIDALIKLDPIIKQTSMFMNGMVKISVPSGIAQKHLNVINGLERVVENLNDLKLFESDTIVSMGAMSKYEENTNLLQVAMSELIDAITQN